MRAYQISYDLRKQRNYNALYERIKKLGGWCHPLESSWVVTTRLTASQVHDNLRLAMDRDDGLLVTRLDGEAAWSGLDANVSGWLKRELSKAQV